ncbi:MAG: FGGY-family carbohydrate kinase [Christensenellales bacterium]|jgi:xylulokinase
MAFLGVDIGTGGCKALICDEAGNTLGQDYYEYSPQYSGGYHEIDPQVVWLAVKTVIRNAVERANGCEIQAVAFSSLGESAVPVDEKGNILGRSMIYSDSRGDEQLSQLVDELGQDAMALTTGLIPHRMYTLPKVMWIRDNCPQLYAATHKFLLYEDFAAYMLSGECYVSYSSITRSLAFDITQKQYAQPILEAAGIPESKFSKPVQSGYVMGTVRPEMAKELGLSLRCKVVAGGVDQLCSTVGAGIDRPGLAVNSLGSVHCLTALFDAPPVSVALLKTVYEAIPHVLEGMYYTMIYNFSGCSLLRWFRNTLARYEYEQCRQSGRSVYEALDALVTNTPSDLLVLPHFAGARFPVLDNDAKGMIWGLSLNTSFADLYQAFLQGIGFEMYHCINNLKKAGIELHALHACGGGANSSVWLQMQADIYNLPIRKLCNNEAAALGNVCIAATAAGAFASLAEAERAMVKFGATFTPDAQRHERYMEKFERHGQMYRAGKSIAGQ